MEDVAFDGLGGWEGGGKNSQNLSHLYSSINFWCFHASSSRTLNIYTLLTETWILYFGPFRRAMKIRIAVTLVVLGLQDLGPGKGPRSS